jgi:hypothetical protein
MLKITQTDAARMAGLGKLLNRAKFELDGAEEIMAANQIIQWGHEFNTRVQADLQEQVTAQKAKVELALSLMDAPKQSPLASPKKKGK